MSKTKPWFIKVRGSYLPYSFAGKLTYIPYLAYTIGVLVYVFEHDFTFWTSFFIVIPNLVAAAAVMNWIAARKS